MSKAIAICNQKGGVGKSTTAINVSSYLALSGKRTLLIDLDPQGNTTTACGIQRKELEKEMYAVLMDGLPISEAVQKSSVDGLEVLPASLNLAGAEPELTNTPEREFVLRKALEPIRSQYEFIFFDCPPSLGLLTVNALAAADLAVIPVQCEYLALEGLSSLLKTIDLVKQRLNPSLYIGGIVLTMMDARANLNREVAEEVRRFFKDLVFATPIPRSVRLAESPSFGKPICLYDPNSSGALAYRTLAQEVIEKIGAAHNEQAAGQRA